MAVSALTKTQRDSRWHVLGAGSVGSLFAAYLQGAGAGVTLLPRQSADQGKRIIENGPASGEYRFDRSAPCEDQPIDLLLVTTKAYDVTEALQSIGHRLRGDCAIVLLVNGMGLPSELAAVNLPGKLYFATTTEGAYRESDNRLTHAGTGVTRVGRQGEAPPAWFGLWQEAINRCHWDTDIESALWLKLAINCAINPLTALHNCYNGELAEAPALRERVSVLCAEIAAVAQAAGYDQLANELEDQVFAVIRGTADNRSSMLQDLRAGRRTEIDYLTGYLVRLAGELDIPVPMNLELLKEIKTHE
jgi:2-dehydropantoate 2-reductase